MKILVLKNHNLETKQSFLKAKDYFKSKGIEVSFFEKEIDEKITLYPARGKQGFDRETGQATNIQLMAILPYIMAKYSLQDYDGLILAYNSELVKIKSNESYCSWTYPNQKIELVVNPYAISKDELWKTITHEMMHLFCYILKAKGHPINDLMDTFEFNDDPYHPKGNYSKTLSSIKPYLSNLITPVKYKYFSEKEVKGLKPELVSLLDKMRGECGFPFIINSGYRTQAENDRLKNSVKDSSHLTGLAVDLKVKDSNQRFILVKNAIENGIVRIGVDDTFVHIDISKSHPQEVIWLY